MGAVSPLIMRGETEMNEKKILIDLKKEADVFMWETFGMECTIPIKLNGRLKVAMGRFVYTRKEAKYIDIAKELILHNEWEKVVGVLHHELVHYGLHEKKLPFGDGDVYFQKTCNMLNVPLVAEVKTKVPVVQCDSCGKEWVSRRRVKGMVHRHCGGSVKRVRYEIV